MRIQTVILGCVFLAICLIRGSDAQCATPGACTADECADTANADDPSCAAEEETTAADAAATDDATTAAASEDATTVATSTGTGNRRLRRLRVQLRRQKRKNRILSQRYAQLQGQLKLVRANGCRRGNGNGGNRRQIRVP
ncbi:uncharacterized protein LOC108658105, partial [Drosophila navojoa]|uniref:uncharacterized protein LOC108658105 n=1 Tax=Drosophila navojoa TaxID=7232 RepID=UPI000846D651